MTATPVTATEALHPLVRRLVAETGAAVLGAEEVDPWLAEGGAAMLVFTEEPERYKETLDLAVIAPELAKARPGAFRVGVLPPAAARAAARRYGFARWPALVLLRDGGYLGAIDGLRDWAEYLGELDRLLAAAPSRPPLAIVAAGGAPSCH